MTERHPARHDRYLVNGVGIRQHPGDQGMAGLVISRDRFIFGIDLATLPLGKANNTIDRFLELFHDDLCKVAPGGEQGCFVDQVRQVSAAEADRALTEHLKINLLG